MKGLLIKDFCLIKNQKTTVLYMFIICAVFSFAFSDFSADFFIPFIGIISMTLALGTISYDEFDNGEAFLHTLPFSKKSYVREKFLFSYIIAVIGGIIGHVFCLIKDGLTGLSDDIWLASVITLVVCSLIASLNIPIRIKYGNEQGKTISSLIMVVVYVACLSIIRYFVNLASLGALFDARVLVVVLVGSVILVCLSYFLSVKMINKKEF